MSGKYERMSLNRITGPLPRVGTPQAIRTTSVKASEVARIVDLAKATLGLNTSQIANFVGVSRPSLYNHVLGKKEPESMAGYEKLDRFLGRLKNEVHGDISSGLKSVLVNERTLLHRLSNVDFDQDEFVRAAHIVAKRLQTRSGSTTISKSEQRSVTRFLGTMG